MIAIVVVTYNIDTRIFLLQIDAIKRFCNDENYKIEIVDNSTNLEIASNIRYQCKLYNLSYRKTNALSVNGTDSHTFAANFSYSVLKNYYDYFFYLDHDCIPIRPFSIKEMLNDKIMAGLGQGQVTHYFWAGCVMWNNKQIDQSLIDFSANHDLHLDTGGQLYKVIEYYGADKCVFFNEQHEQNPYYNEKDYNFYALINDSMFMHFINSSNWNAQEKHQERINSLINVVENKIKLVT